MYIYVYIYIYIDIHTCIVLDVPLDRLGHEDRRDEHEREEDAHGPTPGLC